MRLLVEIGPNLTGAVVIVVIGLALVGCCWALAWSSQFERAEEEEEERKNDR